ncbi:MAG: methylated-DNA--[protein]-cysteine S-methyltransferase [Chloroflexota bacterium]|nr:methylated-DNA--[protein]-cysteine S-methyltransferase [Chloroflexota bacterium]
MSEELLCSSLSSPVGPLMIAVSAEGVCRVAFGGDVTSFTAELVARGDSPVTEASEPPVQIAIQFADYFAGKRKRFTLSLDYRFTTSFQRLVFKALLEVERGRVVSYGELARRIGRPRAARGVGSALAHNPLPILVPCHRVIHKDGTLAGYSAGVRVKEYLLTLEGVMLPIQW